MLKKALTQRAISLTRHRIDRITPDNMNPFYCRALRVRLIFLR